MNAELIERVKRIIQDFVEGSAPHLRIGCDKRPVFPIWELAHLTLPNPQLLGKIQFTRLECLSWTEERYVDELKRWIDDICLRHRHF